MFRCAVAAVFFALGCLTHPANANEVEPDKEPMVFQVNEGDQIYFRLLSAKLMSEDTPASYYVEVFEWTRRDGNAVSSRQVRTTTNHSSISIGSDGTASNADRAELLIEFSPRKSYIFVIRQNRREELGRIEIYSNTLKMLQDKVNDSPNDFKKWTLTIKGAAKEEQVQHNSEIVLAFAGRSHRYELEGIVVPTNSDHYTGRKNLSGKPDPNFAPILRVYIDANGVPLPNSGLAASVRAWSPDFPSGQRNVWEVREGIGARYLIRLRDARTWVREIQLLERRDIKAEDFREVIREQLPIGQRPERAVQFRFTPIP